MKSVANALLGMAKSVASMGNSGISIRIRENSVDIKFISKDNENQVWEGHYGEVDIYLEDMANPVKFTFGDNNSPIGQNPINVLDNAISSKMYQTFMEQEAQSRMFDISGPKQDMIIKLLYAILGTSVLALLMLLAVYGGM